jgi:hypothetical protein
MPPDPCKHCYWITTCPHRGLAQKKAIYAWLAGMSFECGEHTPVFHHGIEGVFA